MPLPDQLVEMSPEEARKQVEVGVGQAYDEALTVANFHELQQILRGEIHLPNALGALVTNAAIRKGANPSAPTYFGKDEGWHVKAMVLAPPDAPARVVFDVYNNWVRRTFLRGAAGRISFGLDDASEIDEAVLTVGRDPRTAVYKPWLATGQYADQFKDTLGEVVGHHDSGAPITNRDIVWRQWRDSEDTMQGFLMAAAEVGRALYNTTEPLYE